MTSVSLSVPANCPVHILYKSLFIMISSDISPQKPPASLSTNRRKYIASALSRYPFVGIISLLVLVSPTSVSSTFSANTCIALPNTAIDSMQISIILLIVTTRAFILSPAFSMEILVILLKNDHRSQVLRAFSASVLVPRRIRIHRKSPQVKLEPPALLRRRHPFKERHSDQPAVRMPAQRHIQPTTVKSIIPDHRFRIMACQNIDSIHLSQLTHESLLFISPVIMPYDPAQIYRSTALGSKTDNLIL